MFQTTFEKRVRYVETDRMSYLYYGNYAQLYEIGRAEMIRELGVSYLEMEEKYGCMMPVMHLECRYRIPAYYDDLLTIETTLQDMPTKMMTFNHRILRGDELLNTGVVKLFFIDIKANKRVSCPEFLRIRLAPYFGS